MCLPILLLPPKIFRMFGPKTANFCPKICFLGHMQALSAHLMPCWLVGGCGGRAVSRKTPLYFIIDTKYQGFEIPTSYNIKMGIRWIGSCGRSNLTARMPLESARELKASMRVVTFFYFVYLSNQSKVNNDKTDKSWKLCGPFTIASDNAPAITKSGLCPRIKSSFFGWCPVSN